jgi:hypothetical protein
MTRIKKIGDAKFGAWEKLNPKRTLCGELQTTFEFLSRHRRRMKAAKVECSKKKAAEQERWNI